MIDKTDEKTRKQWLISFLAITILNQIYVIFNTLSSDPIPNMPIWFNPYMMAINLILPTLFSWATYHCAYKKPGTKLLTFLLISSPVGIILTAVLFSLGKLPQIAESRAIMSITLLQQAAGLWLFILNWKMRTINKKLQNPPVLSQMQ